MILSKVKKFFFSAILVFLVSIVFAEDKIVAIVNYEIITQKDLNDFINFMRIQAEEFIEGDPESKIKSMKSDLLDRLIEGRLILQEAKKNNIKIDENRVKARIEEIKKQYASDIEFQNALSQYGLVQADIESRIKEQLLMYNIIDIRVRNSIVINPGEVTDFYNKNIKEFKIPEQREFVSIKVDNEDLANEIFDNLKKENELNDLIKRHSLVVNKFNARKNGELRKDIEEVVFNLKLGQISKPIKIQDTYYIFKLDNIIPARQQNLSEVQDRIYAFLFDKKMQDELTRWLDGLKKQSYIKILQN